MPPHCPCSGGRTRTVRGRRNMVGQRYLASITMMCKVPARACLKYKASPAPVMHQQPCTVKVQLTISHKVGGGTRMRLQLSCLGTPFRVLVFLLLGFGPAATRRLLDAANPCPQEIYTVCFSCSVSPCEAGALVKQAGTLQRLCLSI